MKYEVWSEGFLSNGCSGFAQYLGSYEANSFAEACKLAMVKNNMLDLFNEERLTCWGCRLYDNETDARDMFG